MTIEANHLKTIDMLFPKSLDDIVRQRRELCTIRLSTPDEVAVLERAIVTGETDVKGCIADWRVVCLDRAEQAGGPVHILIGFSVTENCAWSTSSIVAIDRGIGFCVTKSGSIYKLEGPQSSGEPDMHQRIRLCIMLNVWGWGAALGVPPFFN